MRSTPASSARLQHAHGDLGLHRALERGSRAGIQPARWLYGTRRLLLVVASTSACLLMAPQSPHPSGSILAAFCLGVTARLAWAICVKCALLQRLYRLSGV